MGNFFIVWSNDPWIDSIKNLWKGLSLYFFSNLKSASGFWLKWAQSLAYVPALFGWSKTFLIIYSTITLQTTSSWYKNLSKSASISFKFSAVIRFNLQAIFFLYFFLFKTFSFSKFWPEKSYALFLITYFICPASKSYMASTLFASFYYSAGL